MNKIILIGIVVIALVGAFLFRQNQTTKSPSSPFGSLQAEPSPLPSNSKQTGQTQTDIPKTTVIAQNLEVVWGIAFLPDNSMLLTERSGKVRHLTEKGINQIAQISEIKQTGESGLHGIAVHPKFSMNKYIYLYYTYEQSGQNNNNRVVRYVFDGTKLQQNKIIIDKIPGALFHDGGRIKFGPDGYLYITTGDAQEPSLAQNTRSLAGKILRVTDEGKSAPENPFNNEIYSYGHRNPQGITWDNSNQLWETEHGPTAHDEVNKIEKGKNYGWPDIKGDETKNSMQNPILQSGDSTWAPAGVAYLNNSLFFVGLRGSALYEIHLDDPKLTVKEHFKNEFGRIREVIAGPDGMLYIGTSNRDGRNINPKTEDDQIIRINPSKLN